MDRRGDSQWVPVPDRAAGADVKWEEQSPLVVAAKVREVRGLVTRALIGASAQATMPLARIFEPKLGATDGLPPRLALL